ncbi:MAG TPA: pilus assembly PilX N-terminal domain-containing protein [Gaiellaceae bacterium]|jgi:hypothetical protein
MKRLRNEAGQAMMMVVILVTALGVLSTGLVQAVMADQSQANDAQIRQKVLQAAQAGIDDYTAKLLDDNQYFLHYLAPGESTRFSATSGGNIASVLAPASPTPWPSAGGTAWSYPSGKNAWVDLGNGYSYNLEIMAPQSGNANPLYPNTTNYLEIVSTGKQNGTNLSATNNKVRVLQEFLSPASVADFQMLADASISYGSAATTYGKIYAGVDPNNPNNKYNVNHDGVAYGNIYAEGNVTGGVTMMNGAQKYNSTNIRTVIKNPIQFSGFLGSFSDISRAAQNAGGIYLNNSAYAAWWLTFNSNGTVDIKGCTATQPIEDVQPTSCTTLAGSPKTLPQNGAIYAEQSVIVAGGSSVCGGSGVTTQQITGSCVKGRVTVASNNDVVIGGNIDYVTDGTDTLGLMAKGDMLVAQWSPATVSWRAAALAQTGKWQSAPNAPNGSHNGTMTFTGSTAAINGGQMSMFDFRVYQYDSTLAYLQPPWFPTVSQSYTVQLFRELPPS